MSVIPSLFSVGIRKNIPRVPISLFVTTVTDWGVTKQVFSCNSIVTKLHHMDAFAPVWCRLDVRWVSWLTSVEFSSHHIVLIFCIDVLIIFHNITGTQRIFIGTEPRGELDSKGWHRTGESWTRRAGTPYRRELNSNLSHICYVQNEVALHLAVADRQKDDLSTSSNMVNSK